MSLTIYLDSRPIRHRPLTHEERARVRTGNRIQHHVMLLESPKPGQDLTYTWEDTTTEMWVRWPCPHGGHFTMRIER